MSILNNVFVIAHEIMHNLMCHSTRRSGRDPRLWNIAGDYCINSLLEKLQVGEIPKREDGTPNCLLDYRYDGSKLSTEAVYNMLMNKVQPEEEPKGEPEEEPETAPQEGDGQDAQPKKSEDLIDKQFKEEIVKSKMGLVEDYVPDDHNNWEPSDDDDNLQPQVPSSGQELEDMYTEARVHGEFAGEKQSGDGGFDWEEIIALNSEEILSWEDALREYLTVKSRTVKNWMKPSNKWLQLGFWMPSKGGKTMDDIVIMIDESGSMSEEEIQAVFTNISELFEGGDVPLCKVAVIHFSGYDNIPDEHVEIVHEGDMPEYSRRTSGGTNFEGAFRKAVQLEERGEINPSCYIMMTDMEDYYPEEPDYPVLWMSTQTFEQVSNWPGIPEYGKFTQLMV
jgi:predicted metal-dependent peptidase